MPSAFQELVIRLSLESLASDEKQVAHLIEEILKEAGVIRAPRQLPLPVFPSATDELSRALYTVRVKDITDRQIDVLRQDPRVALAYRPPNRAPLGRR